MPKDWTDSPLAQKYGQARVVRARNLVQAMLGIKPGSEKDKDKIPWFLVGKIVQDEVKGKKLVKPEDIKKAQERFKKYGPDPSVKKYFKQSKRTYKKEKEEEKKEKVKSKKSAIKKSSSLKKSLSKKVLRSRVSRETLKKKKGRK